MITIKVSGKAYYACLDPNATGVPGEEGWPAPFLRTVGRGFQAVYEVTVQQANDIAYWLKDYGEIIGMDGADDDLAESRACKQAAKVVYAQIAQQS